MEQMLLVEEVECPEHFLPGLHLELAPADLRLLTVDGVSPELARRGRIGADTVHDEVLERVVEASGPGEAGEVRGVVERARGRRPRVRVCPTVRPVALVRAGADAGHGVHVGGDRALEDRLRAALDPDIDLRRRGLCCAGSGGERGRGCKDREGPDAGRHSISLPFREGSVAFGRRQVSWLPGLSRSAPSQGAKLPSGLSRQVHPVTVAGPRRHRTGLPRQPTAVGGQHTPGSRLNQRSRLAIVVTAASSTAAANAIAPATSTNDV